jgi:hypothetical protein
VLYFNVVTYLDPRSAEKDFTKQKKLGTGGDGIVMLYKHNVSKTSIAVKFPRVMFVPGLRKTYCTGKCKGYFDFK